MFTNNIGTIYIFTLSSLSDIYASEFVQSIFNEANNAQKTKCSS